MELEKAINIAYGIKDSFRQEGMINYAEAIEIVLQKFQEKDNYYEDIQEAYNDLIQKSIPKKKIREKLKEVQLPNVIVGGRRNGKTLEYGIKLGRIKAYEELLEDK